LYDLKKTFFCKGLAIFLSMFLLLEAYYLFPNEPDYHANLQIAKQQYLNGDYMGAKVILERIADSVTKNEPDNNYLLAKVHLLLGACDEMLNDIDSAKQNYKIAKLLIGEEETIELEDIDTEELILYGQIFDNQIQEQGEIDELLTQFENAKKAFFEKDYEKAKEMLEKLEEKLATTEGRYTLKGETFLLMGATYEKLDYKKLAIKYYCKAKEILGEGKTIKGLNLNELKYYKEACKTVTGAVAQETIKRKSSIGKVIGALVFLAAVGGLVWYLFFSKNAPLKKKAEEKAPGKYTSITVKIDVTYSGLNSKGRRKLTIDGSKKLDEKFTYPQKADSKSTCDDATKKEDRSFTVTITSTSMTIKQEYLNWDYYTFKSPGTNYKILCTNWNFSIVKYEYEKGKADPGPPVPQGLDQLSMDIDNDCVQKSQRVHDCTTIATITFKAPTSKSEIQQVYSVTQTKIRTTHN